MFNFTELLKQILKHKRSEMFWLDFVSPVNLAEILRDMFV
jgi:hypothetical protein